MNRIKPEDVEMMLIDLEDDQTFTNVKCKKVTTSALNSGMITLEPETNTHFDDIESKLQYLDDMNTELNKQCNLTTEMAQLNAIEIRRTQSIMLTALICALVIIFAMAVGLITLGMRFNHIDTEFGQVLVDIADDEAYIEDLELKLDRYIEE